MKNPIKINSASIRSSKDNEYDGFLDEVMQEFEKLDREQTIKFVWRFAIRTLPFLGVSGNFHFWKEKERQKYLHTIFLIIDLTSGMDFSKIDIDAIIKKAEKASGIAGNSLVSRTKTVVSKLEILSKTKVANKGKSNTEAAENAVKVAVNEVDDVKAGMLVNVWAWLAYFVSLIYQERRAKEKFFKNDIGNIYISSLANLITKTVKNAVESAIKEASNIGIDCLAFQKVILLDIQDEISSGLENTCWQDLYGNVWSNFLKAMEENGCSYWAQLYITIFENDFELDQEALQLRLNVPAEIQEKGAAEVARYLEELEIGAERLNEARILILGDKGAGKTCLARKLVDPDARMTTDEESTQGVDTSLWKLKEENVNVHIWDFAGHTVTHSVHQFFLSERCLYIIVYDGRTEERNRLEYWLNHMKNYGKDSQAIILVNTRDENKVEIPINKLKEQYPIFDVCTFSIRDDKEELEDFRRKVADYISNNPSWSKLLIPENSYKVKNELEKLFVNEGEEERKERIERNEFDVIAKRFGVKDSESLLNDLHALGISLWYKEMAEFNTLVLNPEWISNGVYRIINWANNAKKHCLHISDFDQVFSTEAHRYPQSEHRFLFELMKKYELAYEAKEKDVLIIPRLLNEDQPACLPQFSIGESLMARYKADRPLLPDTISRFIVRHNQEIKLEGKEYKVWRHGVILDSSKGDTAMVREVDDWTISVSVKGSNKTEYLSMLRETLNAIFESYKSKKPELQYRVQRFGEISEEIEKHDPLWLSDRKILAHTLQNIPYLDENTGQKIPLDSMLDRFNLNVFYAGRDIHWDQSTHNTFNFKDCNISLQGSLNDLARQLTKAGNIEDSKELKEAAALLAEAEECKTPEEVKKKGIAAGLQRFAEKLGDENSSLCKTIKGIETGVGIAQDIAKGYNSIAQWLALPQIPNVFLKK